MLLTLPRPFPAGPRWCRQTVDDGTQTTEDAPPQGVFDLIVRLIMIDDMTAA